jgi:predicted DNA-binding ribbon-helix-helix protein
VDLSNRTSSTIHTRKGSDMKSSIVKRSVIIGGHKTSISLEDEFWHCVRDIADQQRVSVSTLLKSIDNGRDNANLSSAIRVFVVEHFRLIAQGLLPRQGGGHVHSTFVTDAPILP